MGLTVENSRSESFCSPTRTKRITRRKPFKSRTNKRAFIFELHHGAKDSEKSVGDRRF
jgi:hypothetical protein